MRVIKTSIITGNTASMDLDVTEAQLVAWRQGALIQEVMPHLSADEREFLISGITPAEWDEHMRDWDEWATQPTTNEQYDDIDCHPNYNPATDSIDEEYKNDCNAA